MATRNIHNEKLKAQRRIRVARIRRLRAAGETFEAIGKLLGISKQRASKLHGREE